MIYQSVLPIRKDQYGAEVKAADEDTERRYTVCRFGCTVSGKYAGRYVVSNNKANKHSTVITVVPLSTKIYKKQSLPTHVFISAYKAEGLEQHSTV